MFVTGAHVLDVRSAPILIKHHFRVERRAPDREHKGRSNYKIDALSFPKIDFDFWADASARTRISSDFGRFAIVEKRGVSYAPSIYGNVVILSVRSAAHK